ncbi:MAG: DoxX family protein [Bacteroidetes bacterium]|nr:DoxX family protein [Bacteroidota bacterium]
MKKTNIIYWVITGIFSAFMAFSAIPDILSHPDAIKMISEDLGYPEYILPFLGVAKLLGAITLLVPGFLRIKEWAYAGLFFDLAGATYSALSVDPSQIGILFMILPFSFLFASYFLHHKRLKENPVH